jgi:hypothetical protein
MGGGLSRLRDNFTSIVMIVFLVSFNETERLLWYFAFLIIMCLVAAEFAYAGGAVLMVSIICGNRTERDCITWLVAHYACILSDGHFASAYHPYNLFPQTYQTIRRNIPRDRNMDIHRRWSLKSNLHIHVSHSLFLFSHVIFRWKALSFHTTSFPEVHPDVTHVFYPPCSSDCFTRFLLPIKDLYAFIMSKDNISMAFQRWKSLISRSCKMNAKLFNARSDI